MDATYLQRFLSDSAKRATRSEIRELLKLLARPEVISLAGGLPPPDSFPIDELIEMVPRMLRQFGATALQYGTTEGDLGLRREILALAADEGVGGLTPDNVLVTSGSQQGLDLLCRVFLAPGDTVVCGLPSYLGALGAFAACGTRAVGVPLDDDGLRTDLLEQRLVELRRDGVRPKLVYLVPDFQNPSGVTLSAPRRREVLQIAAEFDLLVVEDSPYRHLRYVGPPVPSVKSLDRDGRVISLRTFSKILSPGLRLGWIVADAEIVSRLVVAKQPVDLCTSALCQLVAREYLRSGRLPAHIERVRQSYARKRDALLAALERHFDPAWGVRWTRPEGGLFLWVTLPEWVDAAQLLQRALAEDVAFVCGSAFHCDGGGHNTLRLNFSYPTPEQLDQAACRLARAIRALVGAAPRVRPPLRTGTAHPSFGVPGHSLEQLAWNLALSEVMP